MLLEKETLDLRAIIDVLGDRPFPPKSNFKAYLESKKKDSVKTPENEQKASSASALEKQENQTISKKECRLKKNYFKMQANHLKNKTNYIY